MSSQAFPPFSIHIFDKLASTNQTVWKLIEAGAGAGTVAIARQQTAGRGQWGRQWSSSEGGLYLSVALEPNIPAENGAQLTMCSAWGIASSLRDRGIPVSIKWPNDLILEKRKLGGILTETRVQKGQITKAVVGVGINWANVVPETGINLQTFQGEADIRAIASLDILADVTLAGIASGYQFLVQKGITDLLPKYLALLTRLGHPVVAHGRSGVVVGVSPTGELRVNFQSDSIIPEEICLKPGAIALGYEP